MKTKRKLVPFRLWDDEVERLKAKIVLDNTNFQKVMEVLVKMYLEDNKEIMGRVAKVKREKNASRRRHNSFDELETDALMRKVEEVSPISEVDRMIKEIEKENG